MWVRVDDGMRAYLLWVSCQIELFTRKYSCSIIRIMFTRYPYLLFNNFRNLSKLINRNILNTYSRFSIENKQFNYCLCKPKYLGTWIYLLILHIEAMLPKLWMIFPWRENCYAIQSVRFCSCGNRALWCFAFHWHGRAAMETSAKGLYGADGDLERFQWCAELSQAFCLGSGQRFTGRNV